MIDGGGPTTPDRLTTPGWRLSMAAVAAMLLLISAATDARGALTEGPRLAHIYDTILDARFDAADGALARACPPAPGGACRALAAASAWWQINIDPDNHAFDARMEQAAGAAIDANEAWTHREPQRGEAWFYLAASYAPRVNFRALRGERVAAARDGNRIREALERALQLDPSISDAHFGIGLYHYYAAVAPLGAKILRWLLLLPGGDRERGMKEMLDARAHGELLRGEADYQLQQIDLWYEHKPVDALDLLRSLDGRYPHNPLFLERIAIVEDQYLHHTALSAAAWRELRARARADAIANARVEEQHAQRAIDRLTAR